MPPEITSGSSSVSNLRASASVPGKAVRFTSSVTRQGLGRALEALELLAAEVPITHKGDAHHGPDLTAFAVDRDGYGGLSIHCPGAWLHVTGVVGLQVACRDDLAALPG